MVVSLFDLKGQLVLNKKLSNSDQRLNISGLDRGAYLIEIKNLKGEKLSIKKVEIQ